MQYDVLVLGGGPAGVTAALRARELGATVALIERDRMGGTCTNDGCVPTRVLAKAARLVRDAEQFADYGLVGSVPEVDFARVIARTSHVVDLVHDKKQLIDHLQAAGVKVLAGVGNARFVDNHTLSLAQGEQLSAERIIVCVGGHARRLTFPGAELALTHSDVWRMSELPRRLAIVGGAATGCQLASVFAAFGSEVFLLDVAPRILVGEDEQVSQEIERSFLARRIGLETGISEVSRIEQKGDGLALVYRREDAECHLAVDSVIMAVGWPGNVESLGLPAAGVEVDRGYIVVNDHLQSSVPHIFAAGDITGRMMLVQSGTHEGRIAAENAVRGVERAFEHGIVPHGGFTDPEYGSVGLTEAQARDQEEVAVAVVPYSDLDRAIIDGHREGFCKLIVSRESHKILGAHVVGEQAVEVVQMVATGMAAGVRIEQLAELELAYPTFTAIIGLAARQLVRTLGLVAVAPGWQQIAAERVIEWERSGH